MAKTSVEVAADIAHVWERLQQLDAWEGVAGIGDLTNRRADRAGNLAGFDFVMHTPLGEIRDRADVVANQSPRRSMALKADQKGVLINVTISLTAASSGSTSVDVEVHADAKSLFTQPLATALNVALSKSVEAEANKIASRVLQ